ncbi:DJ-1/PfpI family protein [Hymenobacter sp. YC55]|uniref:DJ-1/PfpI family protein n=1 Tax=Hymenobacter sp. YC55 TaxID=3034019 RepID=UPI0023F7EBBD|nr:DJ-1/PfpI family protein [Hymenobacter sp. YC55]MDF7811828.1 DJ-1/PfpI family protein [Hymenobacter sp. YC55]
MKAPSLLLVLFLVALWPAVSLSQPLTDASAVALYCPPCGADCDLEAYAVPGNCRHCGMALAQRSVASIDSLRAQKAQAKQEAPRKNVAVLVFSGMEILDFAGPSEVFAVAPGFNVYTVAVSAEPVNSQGFVKITPNYTLANCPPPDIVVVPGGSTDPLLHNEPLVRWIQTCATSAEVMLSVCTGAALFGKAGLLDGKQATTFHNYINALQRANPKANVLRDTRFVDNGQIITTAGISAGIDGALHVVARLRGEAVAQQTAQHMEYDKWQPQQGVVVKATTTATKKAIR